MAVFGVDEAGKGPVLGSMFAAAVLVPELSVLPEAVADSKTLAPSRREPLAARLREDDRVAVGVAEMPVERIDAPDTDMNGLTVAAQADALGAVVDGRSPDAVADEDLSGVVDAGDVDAERFARRVRDGLGPDAEVELAAEHGADETDPAVAAASIVAKVERDAHVAALDAEYDRDVGSGYPSDPTTRAFLREHVREHGELPACARRSWSTCEDVLTAAEQAELGEF